MSIDYYQSAIDILERFKGMKVLVVGDLIIDVFKSGDSHRLSPEAPVPVIDNPVSHTTLGGAGNVAANLVALGATPTLVSITDKGYKLDFLLRQHKIDCHRIESDRYITPEKVRVLSNGHHICRIDTEKKDFSDIRAMNRVAETVESLMHDNDYDAVILSDYNKGTVNRYNFPRIMLATAGVYLATDPCVSQEIYYGGNVITPNLSEAMKMTGETNIENIGRKLCLNNKKALITKGADGMVLIRGNQALHLPAFTRHSVVDVSGAGDTVISAFTLAQAVNKEKEVEALIIANIAAGIAVTKTGTAQAKHEEVLDELIRLHEGADKHLPQMSALEN
jgi:D-beta-D-heptose 7-phosphate kinase/D-beta-D-heptose 1-phosphate adenosyltransferase